MNTDNFLDDVIDIDASLAKHPITDDVKVKNKEAAILQHIEMLLMQSYDSCLFRPYVCAGLNDLLFETWSPHLKRIYVDRIKLSLKHEKRVIVDSVQIEPQDNEIIITIKMRLFDTDKEIIYKSTLRRTI